MSTIRIDIYDPNDKNRVENTYTAEGYDLMMGTLEDFISIIDLEKLDDNVEVAKMVIKAYDQLKPLICDVFPEMTSEDWRNVKLSGLIDTIIQLGTAVIENLDILKSGKVKRA
jgi:hypothetical protein